MIRLFKRILVVITNLLWGFNPYERKPQLNVGYTFTVKEKTKINGTTFYPFNQYEVVKRRDNESVYLKQKDALVYLPNYYPDIAILEAV